MKPRTPDRISGSPVTCTAQHLNVDLSRSPRIGETKRRALASTTYLGMKMHLGDVPPFFRKAWSSHREVCRGCRCQDRITGSLAFLDSCVTNPFGSLTTQQMLQKRAKSPILTAAKEGPGGRLPLPYGSAASEPWSRDFLASTRCAQSAVRGYLYQRLQSLKRCRKSMRLK